MITLEMVRVLRCDGTDDAGKPCKEIEVSQPGENDDALIGNAAAGGWDVDHYPKVFCPDCMRLEQTI